MVSAVLEMLELENGDFVLQKANSKEAPLVTIRFSPEAALFLRDNSGEIAKTMIEAGMKRVEELNHAAVAQKDDNSTPPTIH